MSVVLGMGWRGLSGTILRGEHEVAQDWETSLPDQVVVPLYQLHAGHARCLVSPGDQVREGAIIGSPPPDGVAVHAPVPGRVLAITEITLPGNIPSQGVVIKTGGEFDILGRVPEPVDWQSLEPAELINTLVEMGVEDIRDQDRSFITRLRHMSGFQGQGAVIINFSPNEPLSKTHEQLLKTKPAALAQGCSILSKLFPRARIHAAVPSGLGRELRSLKAELRARGLAVKIRRVREDYPQAEPVLLTQAILGKEFHRSVNLEQHGVFILDVPVLFGIYEAVALRKPMIERYVTLAGDALSASRVVKARIGTRVGDIVGDAGGVKETPARVVYGGPLRGVGMESADTPLTKGYDSLILLTESRLFPRPGQAEPPGAEACFQCGLCALHCPMRLNPMRLYKLLDHGNPERAWREGLHACTGCGICSYICPADISLTQNLIRGRDSLGERKD